MRRSNLLYLAGMLVIALGLMGVPKAGWAAYGDYLSTISAGSLNQPAKVAVDQANGDVYVTDAGNKVVKKYDKNGNYISGFSLSVSGTPVGIAVNSTNIFVGDSTNKCVWIYDKNGALVDLTDTMSKKLGGAGSNWKVSMPNSIVIAPSNQIFVVDGDNDCVRIYTATGLYYKSFGTSGSLVSTGSTIYFYYPSGIAFADSTVSGSTTTQNFYVGDQGNNRVQKFSYAYNNVNNYITADPTYAGGTIGTKGDAFGQFLRISDVAWDKNFAVLIVSDSLQMVAQQFEGGVTNNKAFNYSGAAVSGYLNIPTGMAFDASSHKLYVASNQGGSTVAFDTAQGAVPTISITDPVSSVTSCPATYAVAFSGGDDDSSSVTVNLYYYNTLTPTNKILFNTQTLAVTINSFSGTANLDLVGTGPNYMVTGTYKIYAEVIDPTSNTSNADSGAGNIVINSVSGNYTCAMQAKWGAPTVDTDLDLISNGDEINGTLNTGYGNQPTDPNNPDTDGDGLTDGQEMLGFHIAGDPVTLYYTNPNNVDTDSGGVSDGVEAAKGTNPNSAGDDLSSKYDLMGLRYHDDGTGGSYQTYIDIANPTGSTVIFDVNFFDVNGVFLNSAKAVKLPPNGSIELRPGSYVNTASYPEGNIEVRQNGGYLVGSIDLTSAGTDGYGLAMPHTTLKNLTITHWVYYPPLGYNNDMVLQNPDSSVTANVDINYWKHDGSFIKTVSLSIPPHASILAHPHDYNLDSYIVGNAEIFCRQGSVAGYSSKYSSSFGYGENLPSMYLGKKFDVPHWVKYDPLGFTTFFSIKNPNPVPATVVIHNYSQAGVWNKDTTVPIAAHGAINLKPTDWGIDSYITGSMWWEVTSGDGVAGYVAKQSTYYGFSDLAGTAPVPTGSALYIPKYWYAPNDNMVDYTAIRNCKSSGTSTAAYNFYTSAGTLVTTTSDKVVNAYGENNSNSKLNSYGLGDLFTGGMVKVDVKTGDIVGYLAQEMNTTGNKGFSSPMQPIRTDFTAPADITNLGATSLAAGEVTLTWTEPGNDGSTGVAYRYVVRSSSSSITAANWQSANDVGGVPTPTGAGNTANMTISGLTSGNTYYFAVKASDTPTDEFEDPNWSGLSNVVSVLVQ